MARRLSAHHEQQKLISEWMKANPDKKDVDFWKIGHRSDPNWLHKKRRRKRK